MELLSIVLGCFGSIIFLLLLYRLVQRSKSAAEQQPWSEEWFSEFSAFRYLPMQRLLTDEDENYLLQMTAGLKVDRAAFRAERRRLYAEYLQMIAADFQRLSVGLRLAIVHAPQDQTREVQSLLGLEWEFRKLLLQARVRLVFHWAGVQPGNTTALINAMQGLEFGLREMRLGSAPAA